MASRVTTISWYQQQQHLMVSTATTAHGINSNNHLMASPLMQYCCAEIEFGFLQERTLFTQLRASFGAPDYCGQADTVLAVTTDGGWYVPLCGLVLLAGRVARG